jgi:predicted nucleotidyltransferase
LGNTAFQQFAVISFLTFLAQFFSPHDHRSHTFPMTTSADDIAAAAARDFARDLSTRWQSQLTGEIIGVYLIGSLAHGGFSRRYSDIDLALVTERGLDQAAFDGLCAQAVALSSELGPKVSVFWTDRGFEGGRFPPLDRADYLDHAVPIIERERIAPSRPTLDEIRGYLVGAPFTNWIHGAEAFAASDGLAPEDRKSYLRSLLYPARFVASFLTGKIMSNDDAVARLQEFCPPELDASIIQRALAYRHAAADPDELFPARTVLPGQVASLERFVIQTVADWR